MIDERYKQIRQQLVTLSEETTASIKSETEYWESYHRRRQEELKRIESSIKMSLQFMSEFEQTIIIRKTELHRLDLANLEQILN